MQPFLTMHRRFSSSFSAPKNQLISSAVNKVYFKTNVYFFIIFKASSKILKLSVLFLFEYFKNLRLYAYFIKIIKNTNLFFKKGNIFRNNVQVSFKIVKIFKSKFIKITFLVFASLNGKNFIGLNRCGKQTTSFQNLFSIIFFQKFIRLVVQILIWKLEQIASRETDGM